MEVIYEIPGRFRITYVPEFSTYPGGPTHHRPTPFVLTHRADGADKAEQCELPAELFAALVGATPEAWPVVRQLAKYLMPAFALSDGMRNCLLGAPPELKRYANLAATDTAVTPENSWLDPETHPAPYGQDFWTCVPMRVGHGQGCRVAYDVVKAYCNPDGWFDSADGYRLDTPDYYMPIPATPPVKRS